MLYRVELLFSSAQNNNYLSGLIMINNHIGYLFNFPIRIGGFALMFMGLIVTMGMGWYIPAGILLVVGGAYFALTASGIDIDPDIKAVRHYTRYFGFKYGRWNEYPTYPNMCIISKERKRKPFREQSAEDPENPYQYELHLVSRSHRGKVLLQIVYNREKAIQVANRLAGEMNVEVVDYEPPGRTKARRSHSSKKGSHRSHHSKD
jgi:hypothetical protein